MYQLDLTQSLVCTVTGRVRHRALWGADGKKRKKMLDNLLVFLIDGSAEFCIEGCTYAIKQGDILLIPKKAVYTAMTREGCEFFFFWFTGELTPCVDVPHFSYKRMAFSFRLAAMQSQSIYLPECLNLGSRYAEFFTRVSNCVGLAAETSHAARMLLNAELQRIVVMLSGIGEAEQDSEQLPTMLNKIIVYIRKNLTGPLLVSDLAQAFCLSPSYIARLFKHHLNTTPTAYINNEKMYYARRLMHNGDMNVSEIAAYLGYCNVFYFSRLYKKTFGQSPTRDMLDR